MKRRERVVRAAVVVAIGAASLAATGTGCKSEGGAGGAGAAGALRDATGTDWIVSTDADTGAVVFASPKNGPYALPGSAGALQATVLAFLDKHKAVFKMRDPKTELVFDRADKNGDGTEDVRFTQKVNGVPVHGGTWVAHFDNANRVTSMSGAYAVNASGVTTTPKIAAADAETAAKSEATRRAPNVAASALATTASGLEILQVKGGAAALVHVVKVKSTQVGAPVSLTVYVDAADASVRLVTNGIQRATATAIPPENFPPYNQQDPNLTFVVSDADPPTLDADTPSGVHLSVVSAAKSDLGFIPAASTSPTWADVLEPRGIAPAAQHYAEVVVAYYLEHQRNGTPWKSYDGKGSPIIQVVNNNSNGIDNAYWDNDSNTMNYGDGAVDRLEWPTSASFDTIAHEMTHGVTQYTSNLDYNDGEQGGLNESLSDVFASLITHRARGDDGKDFTFCEDDNNAHLPIRSMIQPTLSSLREGGGPSEMTAFAQGKAEAHKASNVPSHAFYLMTHGGTHEVTKYKVPCGIGWAAADKLYWRTLSGFVQQTESFHQFALHTLAVAREQQINDRPVACAWVAVGVMTEDEAKNDWNATCEKDPGDGGTDADASDNILVTQPAQLVECSQPIAGPGVSLTQ